MVIDFHTHTFPAKISEKTLAKLALASHTKYFTDGSTDGLRASMEASGVDYSVNLPVMTSPGQVEKVNRSLMESRESLLSQGIVTFGGMHPDYDNYREELRLLKAHGIPGVKLHPAYQNTDLDDIRMERIIGCASELGLIVLAHAGIDIGITDHNYASVRHILNVLRDVRPEKLVLAHMGNWGCWEDVESDLAGAPVWLDTAFSIGPVTPDDSQKEAPYLSYNLTEKDFVRIARKHGTDKILFATDSPWESQESYIQRIQSLPLDEAEKTRIFSENAKELLQPAGRPY